jgi:hypothetical protein
MPSEYDFLSTYSRRLRRTTNLLMGAGAVLAGACSMALVIALPLQPHRNAEMERATTASPARSSPTAAPSQKGTKPTVDTAAKTITGSVETQNTLSPQQRLGSPSGGAANPGVPKAPLTRTLRETTGEQPASETKNTMVKTNEPTPLAERENGSATTPAHREMTVDTSPDSSANSADRRTRKKHAYKRKPQKARPARTSEDLRHHPFVDQRGVRQGIPMRSERYFDANARAIVAPGPRRFITSPFNYHHY